MGYVAVSRAREDVLIFTNSIEQLSAALDRIPVGRCHANQSQSSRFSLQEILWSRRLDPEDPRNTNSKEVPLSLRSTALAHYFCKEFLISQNTFDYIVWITAKKSVFDPLSKDSMIKPVINDFYGTESLIDVTLQVTGCDEILERDFEYKKEFVEGEILRSKRIFFVLDNLENIDDKDFFDYITKGFNKFSAKNRDLKVPKMASDFLITLLPVWGRSCAVRGWSNSMGIAHACQGGCRNCVPLGTATSQVLPKGASRQTSCERRAIIVATEKPKTIAVKSARSSS